MIILTVNKSYINIEVGIKNKNVYVTYYNYIKKYFIKRYSIKIENNKDINNENISEKKEKQKIIDLDRIVKKGRTIMLPINKELKEVLGMEEKLVKEEKNIFKIAAENENTIQKKDNIKENFNKLQKKNYRKKQFQYEKLNEPFYLLEVIERALVYTVTADLYIKLEYMTNNEFEEFFKLNKNPNFTFGNFLVKTKEKFNFKLEKKIPYNFILSTLELRDEEVLKKQEIINNLNNPYYNLLLVLRNKESLENEIIIIKEKITQLWEQSIQATFSEFNNKISLKNLILGKTEIEIIKKDESKYYIEYVFKQTSQLQLFRQQLFLINIPIWTIFTPDYSLSKKLKEIFRFGKEQIEKIIDQVDTEKEQESARKAETLIRNKFDLKKKDTEYNSEEALMRSIIAEISRRKSELKLLGEPYQVIIETTRNILYKSLCDLETQILNSERVTREAFDADFPLPLLKKLIKMLFENPKRIGKNFTTRLLEKIDPIITIDENLNIAENSLRVIEKKKETGIFVAESLFESIFYNFIRAVVIPTWNPLNEKNIYEVRSNLGKIIVEQLLATFLSLEEKNMNYDEFLTSSLRFKKFIRQQKIPNFLIENFSLLLPNLEEIIKPIIFRVDEYRLKEKKEIDEKNYILGTENSFKKHIYVYYTSDLENIVKAGQNLFAAELIKLPKLVKPEKWRYISTDQKNMKYNFTGGYKLNEKENFVAIVSTHDPFAQHIVTPTKKNEDGKYLIYESINSIQERPYRISWEEVHFSFSKLNPKFIPEEKYLAERENYERLVKKFVVTYRKTRKNEPIYLSLKEKLHREFQEEILGQYTEQRILHTTFETLENAMKEIKSRLLESKEMFYFATELFFLLEKIVLGIPFQKISKNPLGKKLEELYSEKEFLIKENLLKQDLIKDFLKNIIPINYNVYFPIGVDSRMRTVPLSIIHYIGDKLVRSCLLSPYKYKIDEEIFKKALVERFCFEKKSGVAQLTFYENNFNKYFSFEEIIKFYQTAKEAKLFLSAMLINNRYHNPIANINTTIGFIPGVIWWKDFFKKHISAHTINLKGISLSDISLSLPSMLIKYNLPLILLKSYINTFYHNFIVFHDFTSSVLQIQSMLLGDGRYAKALNLENIQENEIIGNIYRELVDKFLEKMNKQITLKKDLNLEIQNYLKILEEGNKNIHFIFNKKTKEKKNPELFDQILTSTLRFADYNFSDKVLDKRKKYFVSEELVFSRFVALLKFDTINKPEGYEKHFYTKIMKAGTMPACYGGTFNGFFQKIIEICIEYDFLLTIGKNHQEKWLINCFGQILWKFISKESGILTFLKMNREIVNLYNKFNQHIDFEVVSGTHYNSQYLEKSYVKLFRRIPSINSKPIPPINLFVPVYTRLRTTKQSNSTAANFTHSLDAAVVHHLFLLPSFLHTLRVLMPIHDCFGTTTTDVSLLKECLRTFWFDLVTNPARFNQSFDFNQFPLEFNSSYKHLPFLYSYFIQFLSSLSSKVGPSATPEINKTIFKLIKLLNELQSRSDFKSFDSKNLHNATLVATS